MKLALAVLIPVTAFGLILSGLWISSETIDIKLGLSGFFFLLYAIVQCMAVSVAREGL